MPFIPEFLLTSLVVIAAPGTGALVTLATALARGRRAAVVAAMGCSLGIVPHMLGAVSGLAALLQASDIAFHALRYAGAAYLLYMAWATLQANGPLQFQPVQGDPSRWQVIREAVLVNALNPKLSLFFLAFLPQFVEPASAHPTRRMLELSAVFMALTFAVFAGYGLLAVAVRARVLARPGALRWVRWSFAVSFGLLAVQLAWMHR